MNDRWVRVAVRFEHARIFVAQVDGFGTVDAVESVGTSTSISVTEVTSQLAGGGNGRASIIWGVRKERGSHNNECNIPQSVAITKS